MGFPLTEEQKKIVDDRGGELLVSAAAGSGKTRVLVERLLDRVTREGLDIDQFLVITYTKAAAAELRSRIALELSSRLAQDPGNRHLRRQATLVYRAQISTIHSFCAALLRESGHLLDLDPDFRLCDEGEANILMVQVLDDLLEGRYENIDPQGDFAILVDTLAAGRDDSRLVQIVLDVFSRVQSHPDPLGWLAEQKQAWALEGVTDAGQTPWGALLLEDGARQAQEAARRLEEALALCGEDELLEQNYAPSLEASLAGVQEFLRGAQAGHWDQAAASLPVIFPPAGRKRKRSTELSPMEEERARSAGERVKALREGAKDLLEKLGERLEGDSAQVLDDLMQSAPAVRGLMDLVADFQQAYTQEKKRRSMLDFSDLEHGAVKLLLDGETGEPTPLAQAWGSRYAEVMVDEYQDTNQVQNAIFTAISQGGRTLFEVGDVKQSIYRFRLADPTIFLDKYRRFAFGEEAEEGEPRKRLLSRNFRSRAQVLEGCNDLFRNIMSRELGELDYTDDQALVPAAQFPGEGDYALELDALDLSGLGDQEGEKEDKNRLEARFAARRIRQLLEQPLMIKEGDGLRPVRPSDVMILLRSPGVVLHHYLRALSREGIPWSADGGEDFFATTEVNVALSILQIVDNPRQDVALIAALRSPVYGFDGDKLALLRAGSKGDFYSALVHAAEEGDQDCRNFLRELEDLRFGAGDRTCRQLIWHIYEKTNMLGIFGAMSGGEERQNNLLTLYALAGQMEDGGCRSLFQFLLRLERLRATGRKITAGGGREGEGVSILSIHKSKGLEKPVVLVCGLARRLNREDLMRPVLFHPVLGVGPKGLDRERMVEYQTLARRAVARQLEKEMMSEELRLLYVAMTRAQEKLIMTVALSDGPKALERLAGETGAPVSPVALERQQSVGQWVLLHALTRPEGEPLRELAGRACPIARNLGPTWDIRWVSGESLEEEPEDRGRFGNAPVQDGEALEDLTAALTWTYPHQGAVDCPSKLTATQLKGRALDQEAAQEAASPVVPEEPAPIRRPDFVARERGLTPAQRGSAIHLAMQYLPFTGEHTVPAIQRELERLVKEGFLTPLQGEAVDPRPLAAFFDSELGRRVLASPRVEREFKFSLLTDAEGYQSGTQGEQVLLQGVVDCWFEEEGGITVLDFKSDGVGKHGLAQRAKAYRPQLKAYAHALERITGKAVKHRLLWFFSAGTWTEV